MKYLFIDIRKSDEVYSKHFDESQEYSFYNIPMNMIRFNTQMIIKNLEKFDEIYIVCQSSSRSQFIKNKYFKDNERIKVSKNLQFINLKYGVNNVRGGSFCEVNLSEANIITLEQIIRSVTDRCYICGLPGHYAKDCKSTKLIKNMINTRAIDNN